MKHYDHTNLLCHNNNGSFDHMKCNAVSYDFSAARFMWFRHGASAWDFSAARFMWFQRSAPACDFSAARFIWFQRSASACDFIAARYMWLQRGAPRILSKDNIQSGWSCDSCCTWLKLPCKLCEEVCWPWRLCTVEFSVNSASRKGNVVFGSQRKDKNK